MTSLRKLIDVAIGGMIGFGCCIAGIAGLLDSLSHALAGGSAPRVIQFLWIICGLGMAGGGALSCFFGHHYIAFGIIASVIAVGVILLLLVITLFSVG